MYPVIHFSSHEPSSWASLGGARLPLFRVEVSQPRDPAHCFGLRGPRTSSGAPGSVPALDSVLACSCHGAGSAAWELLPVLCLEEKQHQDADSAQEVSCGEKATSLFPLQHS